MARPPFHPAVAGWFASTIGTPTPTQQCAWPLIAAGRDTVVAAPTGSGKTLTAFLPLIDALVRQPTAGEVRVLYVSPLKALSHDIEKNLQPALEGIGERVGSPSLTVMVRTGDTSNADRDRIRRRPPPILVTTPESLYIMLNSPAMRRLFGGVRHVVVDELHALAASKRGAHLTLTLERLRRLTGGSLQRIGLSATQKPLQRLGQWLTGGETPAIVDAGMQRQLDLGMELPAAPLGAITSHEQWGQIADRLAELAEEHRGTLIFVNTRRLAEHMARLLTERLDAAVVAAHHGSLARGQRLEAEQALKAGKLKAVVATASLELGIDIGDLELVCQLGTPRAIATLVQRIGRAGHRLGAVPKGRLFPLTRDDLLECTVLLECIRRGELDCTEIPQQPLDVLAQQLLAAAACESIDHEATLEWVRRAWPYRNLSETDFMAVIETLERGFDGRQEAVRLVRNPACGTLSASEDVRRLCNMNAGAIPDQFDQDVWLLPEGERLGSVTEDFAFESMVGDIFQLGNHSYRLHKAAADGLFVEDAGDEPPGIPFWVGEAPGRTPELSAAVATLLASADEALSRGGAIPGLDGEDAATAQLSAYVEAVHAALGKLPTRDRVILERFFDDTGNYHLVIHSVFGIRLNRAWGLALRKRFCRRFNFELQAAATDNALLLSLGPSHSFPLAEPIRYLQSATVREVLVQALLDAPVFISRWRWVANTALAVPRNNQRGRVPPQHQRNRAEDLLALLFPDQLACLENIRGEREIPEHPLVRQAIDDCLFEAMDIEGLEDLLARIEAGEVEVHTADLNGPSPRAAEIVHGRAWSFLDDGEAEERRTRTVSTPPRTPSRAEAARLGTLPPPAIGRLRRDCWPQPRNPDELHQALLAAGCITVEEGRTATPIHGAGHAPGQWTAWFTALCKELRAACLHQGSTPRAWCATERAGEMLLLHPDWVARPALPGHLPGSQVVEPEAALAELLRGRLTVLGPVPAAQLARSLCIDDARVETGLAALEGGGELIRVDAAGETLWMLRRHAVALRRDARSDG